MMSSSHASGQVMTVPRAKHWNGDTCDPGARLPCGDPDSSDLCDSAPLGSSLPRCRMDHCRANFVETWQGRSGNGGG